MTDFSFLFPWALNMARVGYKYVLGSRKHQVGHLTTTARPQGLDCFQTGGKYLQFAKPDYVVSETPLIGIMY